MKESDIKALFSAVMANSHIALRAFYESSEKRKDDSFIYKEVDKYYNYYFARFDFS